MACNPLDPLSCAGEAAKSGLEALARSFAESAGWAVKNMTTAWMGVPNPDVTSASSAASWLEARLSYLVVVAAFLSICAAAYRMATSGEFRHGAELGHSLLRLVGASGLTALLTAGLLEVGDLLSDWLLSETPQLGLGVLLSAATSPGVVILLAVVVILAQIIQLGLMLAKNAIIVAMVGLIPLTAAATNTETGKTSFHRSVTWLAAAVLYKPAAAAIYALSFHLSSTPQSLSGQMSGVALMVLAIFALPALMRLLTPAVAAAAGGNAGAMAGAAVGATIATGAIVATGGLSGAAAGFGGAGAGAASGGAGNLASGAVPAATSAATGVAQTAQNETEDSTR